MRSAMGDVLTGARVRAEGIGIMTKTVTTCLVLWYDTRSGRHSGNLALLAFAAGQLAYGFFLFAIYFSYFRGMSWWPTPTASTCANMFPTIPLHTTVDTFLGSALG